MKGVDDATIGVRDWLILFLLAMVMKLAVKDFCDFSGMNWLGTSWGRRESVFWKVT